MISLMDLIFFVMLASLLKRSIFAMLLAMSILISEIEES